MSAGPLPESLEGYRIHLVGIKGTGMAALAEILLSQGAVLSGSDGPERYYTDEVLQRLGIPYRERFAAEHVGPEVRLVIHSAAYDPTDNPELLEAAARGLPLLSYPEALGRLSERYDACGVAGTHGKTTATAMAGTILQALHLPATVLAGSAVSSFGDRSTLIMGDRYLVAETCEWRRHFLHYRPRRIVLLNVEADHLDYFQDQEDVLDAFTAYCLSLPQGGELIYNQDDAGAVEAARRVRGQRRDLAFFPYGLSAAGEFRLGPVEAAAGATRFRVQGLDGELVLHVPGRHSAANATAALALCSRLLQGEGRTLQGGALAAVRAALAAFRGSRRRSELVGEAGGVTVLDDYGHHPTEIAATLEGLRSFYPGRRLVVDFMPHTYSRTRALLPQFGRCFAAADVVVLHGIYASARERDDGSVSGRSLCDEVRRHRGAVHYFERPAEAVGFLRGLLQPGDLFVTMGAGDNWRVGQAVLQALAGGAS
jgi:UDP-N-acetylmuramate--alanine ligase